MADNPSDTVLKERVAKALKRLPPKRRNIVLLNRVNRMTHDQIAEAYGISVRRVRRHVTIPMHVLALEVFENEPQSWWQRWRP